MQTELSNRKRWRSPIELANSMIEYLEVFHNRQRRHPAVGMLESAPIEYESSEPDHPSRDRSQRDHRENPGAHQPAH